MLQHTSALWLGCFLCYGSRNSPFYSAAVTVFRYNMARYNKITENSNLNYKERCI